MHTDWLPRDPQFWRYHGGVLGLALLATLAAQLLWGGAPAQHLVLALLWPLAFSAAVLLFRWIYKRGAWGQRPMGLQLLAVLMFGALAGQAISALVWFALLPLFWATMAPLLQKPAQLAQQLLIEGLQSQLFVCAWALIYIGINNSRRARSAELQNLRLENALKEARLDSLANQLNPHFLFNALNNIRFMIHEEGAQAERMIVALSEMLRFSLSSSERERVPLAEELAIVDSYLALMKSQLEERLRVELQVEPGLGGALLPPMLLQLLAENAIRHGIEPARAGGWLRLQLARVSERLQIVVANSRPSGDSQPASAGLGLGLKNIEQRLALLYGGHATLQRVEAAERFELRISLPLEF